MQVSERQVRHAKSKYRLSRNEHQAHACACRKRVTHVPTPERPEQSVSPIRTSLNDMRCHEQFSVLSQPCAEKEPPRDGHGDLSMLPACQ